MIGLIWFLYSNKSTLSFIKPNDSIYNIWQWKKHTCMYTMYPYQQIDNDDFIADACLSIKLTASLLEFWNWNWAIVPTHMHSCRRGYNNSKDKLTYLICLFSWTDEFLINMHPHLSTHRCKEICYENSLLTIYC